MKMKNEKFVELRETILSLRKIINEKNILKNRDTEKDLKEEIMLLRKENDFLKNDIRRKDLLIKSFENMEESRKDDRSFQLPKRSVARPLPKNPWKYLSSTSNRFIQMPLATTMDETYAKIVQSNSIGNSNREEQQTRVNGNIHQQCLEKKQVPERIPTASNKSVTATSQASVNRNANTKQDSTNTARKPTGLPYGRKPPVRNCNAIEIVNYRSYQNFDQTSFKQDLRTELSNVDTSNINYGAFETAFDKVLNKHAPLKKKYVRVNDAPFMTKALRKAVMLRTRLRNKYNQKRNS